jgi:hypothetical protein
MINNVGLILLAVGLIVYGIALVAAFTVPPVAVAVWAIVTGVLLLAGR